MKIWGAPYELTFRPPVNKSRFGSLLRFEFEGIGFGYADLFPWPEFRDEPLNIQIANLREGRLSPLLERSVEFARQDAIARKLKKSLFEGVTIPRSHFLFMNPEITHRDLEEVRAHGYRTLKIKLENGVEGLNKISEDFNFKIRLDFNNKLTENQFVNFLEKMTATTKKRIDFIEDPTPFENNSWRRMQNGLALALDCGSDKDFSAYTELGFKYLVLKPARQNVHEVELPKHVSPVFMGYLDHPIGQSFAALEAARWDGDKLDTGLTYHSCYKENNYSERLRVKDATLIPEKTIGIGFGDLLEKESWEFLYES